MPQFSKGDQVYQRSRRDQIGYLVDEPRMIAGEYWYKVQFAGGRVKTVPEVDLEAFAGSPDLWMLLKQRSFADKKTFAKLITFTKIQSPLSNNLYAFASSRTRFYPYQFKPVLKFLDSDEQRLLIADEVGLGKTIEAALLMREMKARHEMSRVLVVCPSGLTGKWRLELRTRFEEDFQVLDSAGMRDFLRDCDENGDLAKLRGICSLQTLRGRQLLEELDAASVPLDLVIIDEAHHLRNSETLSHRVGKTLAETADALILLTATPVHLGNQDLFNLLQILKPNEFDNYSLFVSRLEPAEFINAALRLLRAYPPNLQSCREMLEKVENTGEGSRYVNNPIFHDVKRRLESATQPSHQEIVQLQRDITTLSPLAHVLSRTRKIETGTYAKRTPFGRHPNFTEAEMAFYNAVIAHALRKYHDALELGPFAAFITMMPQRQVASCIQAMIEHYHHQFEKAIDVSQLDASEISDLQVEDFIEQGGDEAKDDLDDLQDLLALKELVDLGKTVGSTDSKFEMFVEDLQELERAQPGRKILVFSYFKATLRYLSRRLQEAGFKNLMISGDHPPVEERLDYIMRFAEDPSIRVLLSSEVGSEGLDFQFCNIMVNYDLPWNPMVVEQRIGRLDRIGQKAERIIIHNYSVPGTIEDRILRRLYQRIGIFEKSIGDLEAILGDEIKKLTVALLTNDLTPQEQEERISQAAQVIVQRQKDYEVLEQSASKFIAHDQFFEDEIERVRKRKRFISSEEVQIFFADFLRMHFPRLSLRDTGTANVLQIDAPGPLAEFTRRHLTSDDKDVLRFLTRVGNTTALRVTFDADTALDHPNEEFLTIYHPLIRAIVSYYRDHPDEMHPVAAVQVKRSAIATEGSSLAATTGDYVYGVYLVETTGARAGMALEAVFYASSQKTCISEELSELLLSGMVTDGETLPDPPTSSQAMDTMINALEEELVKRIQQRKQELTRLNEALVADRLASLQSSFEVKIAKKRHLLDMAHHKRSAPQYIRMLEGGLRSLQHDLEQKRSDIEKQKDVSINWTPVAAGALRIT